MRLLFTALSFLISLSMFGQCSGNCYSGKGTYFHENGDNYEGNWMSGLYNGRGVYTFVNGDVFKGKWEIGRPIGKGDYILANGGHHRGKWSAGEVDFITIQIDRPNEDNSSKLFEKLQDIANSAQSDIDKFYEVGDKAAGKSNTETPKQNIRVRVTENKFHLTKVAVIGKEANLCDGSKDDGLRTPDRMGAMLGQQLGQTLECSV